MTSNQQKFLIKEQTLRSTTWGHHFIFLNCILAIIISFAYVYAAPQTESFISFTYLGTTWLGQISFLAFLAFLIIFFPLTFIGNFKVYRATSMILAFLSHCILLIDAKIFLTLKVHLTWSVVSLMLRDLNFKTGLNFNFMYIAMIILVGLEFLFARLATREVYRRNERHNYFPAVVMSIVTLCFVASHCIYIWADATNYEKITNLRSVFPAHYPMTAKSFLSNHGWIDSISSVPNGSSTSSVSYPLQEIRVEPAEEPKNIITIYINGLSYENLSSETTPNLMALKLDSMSLENHYIPYASFIDNLFASCYGLPVQYKDFFINHRTDSVIVDELQHQEYRIRNFSSAMKKYAGGELYSLYGLNRNTLKDFKTDRALFDEAYDYIIKNRDNNFCVNLISNTLLSGTAASKNEYRQNIITVDRMLASFISRLKDEGIDENTLIIISSLEGRPLDGTEKTGFTRQKQRVPLIIMWPNSALRGVSKDILTSSFDIVPTLGIEILGIKTPYVNYSIGEDILSIVNRDYVPTTQGNTLLLISKDSIDFYQRNGKVVSDRNGDVKPAKPNLENLIRAMRDLNRFKN